MQKEISTYAKQVERGNLSQAGNNSGSHESQAQAGETGRHVNHADILVRQVNQACSREIMPASPMVSIKK